MSGPKRKIKSRHWREYYRGHHHLASLPVDKILIRLLTYKRRAVTYRPYRAFFEPVEKHLTKEHTWECIDVGCRYEMHDKAERLNEAFDKFIR